MGANDGEVSSVDNYTLLIQNNIQVLRVNDSDCLYNIQKTGSRN